MSSGCIAGRIEISYKDHDTLGARGCGKMAEVAEWPTSARVEVVDIPFWHYCCGCDHGLVSGFGLGFDAAAVAVVAGIAAP